MWEYEQIDGEVVVSYNGEEIGVVSGAVAHRVNGVPIDPDVTDIIRDEIIQSGTPDRIAMIVDLILFGIRETDSDQS